MTDQAARRIARLRAMIAELWALRAELACYEQELRELRRSQGAPNLAALCQLSAGLADLSRATRVLHEEAQGRCRASTSASSPTASRPFA